jgi:aminopeptidase N
MSGHRRRLFLLTALAASAAGCLFGDDPARTAGPLPSATTASIPPPLASGRLPDTARPTRYTVALAVDPKKDRFSGTVTIALDVPRPTSAVILNARDLTVTRAEVSAGGKRVGVDVGTRRAAGREAPDELVLALAEPLPAGPAEVTLGYTGPIGNKLSGLFRIEEEGGSYAFTQFEPTDARRMIPCFDEPAFKAPFELKVTAPEGNEVFANMPEVGRDRVDEGRSVAVRFAPTPPLPSYLFALAVGPFDVRAGSKGPVPLRLVAPRGKAVMGELALGTAAAHTAALAAYFDRPFPYPKLDLVVVPELGFSAMENAALISFREDLLLLDPRGASVAARRAMESALAHEIAHHWFGDLVTIAWWDELWLNEGFATWIDAKINEARRPAARLDALRAKEGVMELDGLDSARAVRQKVSGSADAEEAFDDITYDKGAAVLGMLEAWLGEGAFREGVRAYVKAHEQGTATAADLFAALSRASGREVGPVAATFLDQPGVPLVRAELECAAGEPAKVKLRAERYRSRGQPAHDRAWKIPVCVLAEGGDADKPACGLLDDAEAEIPLGLGPGRCPTWIYPNAGERGYFRFALPPEGLAALTRAARKLPPAERLGLVADVAALLQSGDVPADALVDVLTALRGERDLRVVEQMIAALGHLGAILDEAARPAFRAFVSSTLGPTARELGFSPKKGESDDRRLTRVRALAALADLGDDAWVLGEAEKRAAAWLAAPDDVPADLAQVALSASSRKAGEKRFAALLAAAKKARTPEERAAAVRALGGFGDPALLRRALDLLLKEGLKIQDGFHVFNAALARPAARAVVLGWVKAHFGELRGKVPDFALSRLAGVVETICDGPTLEDASSFFSGALKGTEGGERALVQAAEKAELCIDLRGREALRVSQRLGKR